MKMSIRTRLFLSLSLMILFFAVIGWTLTHFGLEKYYIWQKKSSLINYARQVNEIYQGNPEDISSELEQIGNSLGAGMVIIDEDGQVQYSSFGRIVRQKMYDRRPDMPQHDNKGEERQRIPRQPPSLVEKTRENIDAQTTIITQQDLGQKFDFIILVYKLDSGDKLIIRQPLAAVAENAVYAGNFVFFTGLLTILLGFIWSFFYTGKFTRPLIKLNHIAQRMSRLDFSQKADIRMHDEIGELSDSINSMSTKLDAAITELNQKNQQLQADVEKERRLDKMRRDFVSNVSHELKTPLALILGYTEGLRENVAQDAAAKGFYCEVITDEAQKMDRLVKDLLDLSQMESGYFKLDKMEFDLSALLDYIASKYQPIITAKKINLSVEKQPELMAYADMLRIEQVVANMLNNAIDHAEGDKSVVVAAEEQNDKIRVSVYNAGKRIPDEVISNLWTSFYKADKARTRSLGGHGLGLSIVRAIQEAHGNAYGVQNEADGVTFWFNVDKAL